MTVFESLFGILVQKSDISSARIKMLRAYPTSSSRNLISVGLDHVTLVVNLCASLCGQSTQQEDNCYQMSYWFHCVDVLKVLMGER